jgi:hypothetical protein
MRSWAQDEHDVRGVGPLLSLGPRESSGLEAELETVPAALAALLTTFSALSAFAESTLPGAGHRTLAKFWTGIQQNPGNVVVEQTENGDATRTALVVEPVDSAALFVARSRRGA